MKYSSPIPLIFQENPPHYIRKSFKLNGFTETIKGYINEAEKLVQDILYNDQLQPSKYWLLTINIEQEQAPDDIKNTWSSICRHLRAVGITALWVREPTENNRVHYHLIVKDKGYNEEQLREGVKAGVKVSHHINLRRIINLHSDARYITKARAKGMRNGVLRRDIYGNQRRLFKSGLGITKHGTIGQFWVKSRQEIRQSICQREQAIQEAGEQREVQERVKVLAPMFSQYYTKEQLTRLFALSYIREQAEQQLKEAERDPREGQYKLNEAVLNVSGSEPDEPNFQGATEPMPVIGRVSPMGLDSNGTLPILPKEIIFASIWRFSGFGRVRGGAERPLTLSSRLRPLQRPVWRSKYKMVSQVAPLKLNARKRFLSFNYDTS